MNPLRTFNPAVTWASLPAAKRDEIGATVLAWAFADFVAGHGHAPEDRLCNEAIRDEATRDCERLFAELLALVPAALPEVFGPEGEDPAWAWRESDHEGVATVWWPFSSSGVGVMPIPSHPPAPS